MERKRRRTISTKLPGAQQVLVLFPKLHPVNTRNSSVTYQHSESTPLQYQPSESNDHINDEDHGESNLELQNKSTGVTGLESAYMELMTYIESIKSGTPSDIPRVSNLRIQKNKESNPVSRLDFIGNSIDFQLLFYSHLAFAVQFLRTNACKHFKLCSTPQLVKEFREQIYPLLIKLYNKSIELMKEFILIPNFNLESSYVALNVLHIVQFFQHLGGTFQNGLFTIFKELTERNRTNISNDLAWGLNSLEFALVSPKIPLYDPTFLQEIEEKLSQFGMIFDNYLHDPKLILDYRLLIKYFQFVRENVGSTDIQVIGRLLREWFTICPPYVEICEHLHNPFQKTLGLIYRMFTTALINLFPMLMYYFLLGFNGSVDIHLEFPWIASFDDFLDRDFENQDELNDYVNLQKIASYSLSVAGFFNSRLQIYTKYYGYQRRKIQVVQEKVERVLNEIMFKKFDGRQILAFNYPHVAWQTLQHFDFDFPEDIYYYNKDHIDFVRNSGRATSYDDPVLQDHLLHSSFITGRSLTFDRGVDYLMWYESKVAPSIERQLIADYQAFHENGNENLIRPADDVQLGNGLYGTDSNPSWYFNLKKNDKPQNKLILANRVKHLLWSHVRRGEMELPESDYSFYNDTLEDLYDFNSI